MSISAKSLFITAAVSGLLAGHAMAAEITVVSWGGALQSSQTKAFMEPFSKETGISVRQDEWSGELAKLRAMVEGNAVTWDVLDLDPQSAAQACLQGLLEPLDYSKLVGRDELVPGAALDCAVGSSTYTTVLAYRPDAFASAPGQVADIFDTAKFPGKRAFKKGPSDTLEVALMADGVPAEEVYALLKTPEGVDRAFRKLDTIKKDIVWWEAGAQPAQLLQSGEVVMALAWNGRIHDANNNEGANLGVVWTGQVQGFDMWGIPAGSKNVDAAYDFIRFTLQPDVNASLANHISYGPTVKAALANVPADILSDLPTAPENSKVVLVQDPDFWSVYGPELSARFSSWLSQ